MELRSLDLGMLLFRFGGHYFGASLGSMIRSFGNSPSVRDSSGTIYVADSRNDTIRRITPAGVVSTFSGIPGTQGSAN